MKSLTALGITSVSLSSNGISHTAANGDVTVAGTGSYTKADGSTGVLEDAAFLTESRSATNSVLMGALAAAGIAAEGAAAATTTASLAATTALTGAGQHTQSLTPVAVDAAGGSHANNDLMAGGTTGSAHAAPQSAGHADPGSSAAQSAAGSNAHEQAPTELLQGTQAPANDAAANQSVATAASIAMPAAAQLAAAAAAAGDGAAHNQVIGQVLADALHGGGNGPTIDSVLNALPGQADAQAALQALASHGGGDNSVFGSFVQANPHFSMEQMVVHADAAPSHA